MRGALAGAAAAAAWGLSEPVLRRIAGTPYSDVRLLGRAATRGRAWPLAGLALHTANGAVFGAALAHVGRRRIRDAVAIAELEGIALWPLMLIVDHVHPDRRDGTWPPLARNRRVFVYALSTHALFGLVYGLLSRED
jgi:hypothetical protein